MESANDRSIEQHSKIMERRFGEAVIGEETIVARSTARLKPRKDGWLSIGANTGCPNHVTTPHLLYGKNRKVGFRGDGDLEGDLAVGVAELEVVDATGASETTEEKQWFFSTALTGFCWCYSTFEVRTMAVVPTGGTTWLVTYFPVPLLPEG
jgi:hypothetical protein